MLSYEEFKTMNQEMTFMATYRHPRLVNMYGIAISELRSNKLHCCIIMELMENDLEQILFDPQKLNKELINN